MIGILDSNKGGILVEDLLVLDSISEMFVIGCTVDYITELGGHISVINPTKTSCGCVKVWTYRIQSMYEYKCKLVKVVMEIPLTLILICLVFGYKPKN